MAKISAFGGARRAAAPASKGPSGPIFVVEDLKDGDGDIIYSQAELAKAVESYCEGKDIYDRGEALMDKARKPILDFARSKFAAFWAQLGRRPEKSPKVLTDEKGDGAMVTVEFQDRERNLTQAQFDDLAKLVGEDNAKSVTTKGWLWSLNPEMLAMTITELPLVQAADDDGNPLYVNDKNPEMVVPVLEGQRPPKGYKPQMRSQTYFDLLEAALVSKFVEVFGEERAQSKVEGVLVKKPVFKTNKGTIDRLLDFVGRGKDETPALLEDAIVKANVQTAIKPGALKKPAAPAAPAADPAQREGVEAVLNYVRNR